MHLASIKGHKDVARMLLDGGAPFKVADPVSPHICVNICTTGIATPTDMDFSALHAVCFVLYVYTAAGAGQGPRGERRLGYACVDI